MAFLSYVRQVDTHDRGRLGEFRDRLSGEIEAHTGRPFPIFYDRRDIRWGEQWRTRVDGAIDAVTFLIPVVTPGFFTSGECRREIENFLDRETKLGRGDLILPVYYIDCPLLNEPASREANPIADVIAKHNYSDWRDLRHESLTSAIVGRELQKLAIQVRDALQRSEATEQGELAQAPNGRARHGARSPVNSMEGGAEQPTALAEVAQMRAEAQLRDQGPSRKTVPPIHVVDTMHRGNFVTISAAIRAANPGDRILVRLGVYNEGLVIDKPLEVIGDGETGDIVVQSDGQDCLLFQTTMGRVSNLTLRQLAGGEWYCIDIAQGRLELEDCDVTSQSRACVAIHGGADPRIRRNRIHDGKAGGVRVYENGQGTLEDNDIFGNAFSGVIISDGGDPVLRRNRIHDGKAAGVNVYENGQGTLEDNDIFGNALSGVAIKDGSDQVLRRNRIRDCQGPGVLVYENGRGTLEDNDIFGNALGGVTITDGGHPVLRRNRISKNTYAAVWVYENGRGTIEDNDLRDNEHGAFDISEDSAKNVTRARNQE